MGDIARGGRRTRRAAVRLARAGLTPASASAKMARVPRNLELHEPLPPVVDEARRRRKHAAHHLRGSMLLSPPPTVVTWNMPLLPEGLMPDLLSLHMRGCLRLRRDGT